MKYTPLPCCPCCVKAGEHPKDDHIFQCPTHPPKKKAAVKGVQPTESTVQ